jgi:hypothetical protein
VIVRDDRAGQTRRFELGRSCDQVLVPDGNAGLFLVKCAGAGDGYLVLNTRAGGVTPVGGECEEFGLIGRNWLEGASVCSHGAFIYRNWHTGQTSGESAVSGEPRTPFDLDTPDLRALGPQRADFVVGAPRVLSTVRTGSRRKRYAIELREPHHHKRLFRCLGRCYPESLEGGLAIWDDLPAGIRGYVLATHKRITLDLTDSAIVGSTRQRVYYTTPSRSQRYLVDLKSISWR